MIFKPECIDDFYNNLYRIRAELTSIQIGEENWITSKLSISDCDKNIRSLDEFQSSLTDDSEHWEDYDSLCNQIECLTSDFYTLKEDICIEAIKDNNAWINHITDIYEITPRILENIPTNFIENNCNHFHPDITVNSLIEKIGGKIYVSEILALYCFARKGSNIALDILNSVLQFDVVFP